MRTRAEHLAWCKQRALKYVDRGDIDNAVTSMLSDLSEHPETAGIGEKMGLYGIYLLMHEKSATEARRFIEGFQ